MGLLREDEAMVGAPGGYSHSGSRGGEGSCFSLARLFASALGGVPAPLAAIGGPAPAAAGQRAHIETMLQFLNGKGHQGQIPGLPNLGNTCFMNAVLQCLLNTPGRLLEACTVFADLSSAGVSGKGLLGLRFAELATEYGLCDGASLPRSSAAMRTLKKAMGELDERYAGCEQQDAYEFLGCLLEGLDENFATALKVKFGALAEPLYAQGVVRSVCGVQMHSTRYCHACGGLFDVDRTTDTVLRLPLISAAAQMDGNLRCQEEQRAVSLQELLDATQEPEDIEGYDCDQCRACAQRTGVPHRKSLVTQRAGLISGTSDILTVALFRFLNVRNADGSFGAVKINREVAIPTVLSFETGEYRLHGVVSHVGSSLSSGHYISAVRSLRDHQWFHCDDEVVTPIHLRNLYEVSQFTTTRPGATPFILFYYRFGSDMESSR